MNAEAFILIDFENVQPANLEPLRATDHRIKVFLGRHQSKLATEFVELLLPFGPRVELIRIEGNGPNALDFHIAYHLGRLAVEAPGAVFHVISKDAGFDTLIRYLQKQGIRCQRLPGVADIAPKAAAKKIPHSLFPWDEQINRVKDNLRKRPAGRPRTSKTLRSTINALFGKALSAEQLDSLVAELMRSGFLIDRDGKITYT